MSPEIIESNCGVEKNTEKEGSWAPYVGPQGGEGWRNVQTNEIVYTLDPPGPVVGDAGLDDSQQDEERVRPEGVPDTAVDVETSDVERRDYISVDGEVEGFVDFIEQRGEGEAFVMFEDGSSVSITEGMEVYVDDDPPAEFEAYEDFDEYQQILFDTTEVTYEGGNYLSQEDVMEKVSDDMSRCKLQDAAKHTLKSLTSIDQREGRLSYYHPDKESVELSEDVFGETVSHEFGHAFLGQNGYDLSEFGNMLAVATNRVRHGTPFLDLRGKTIEDLANTLAMKGYISQSYRVKVSESVKSDDMATVDYFKLKPRPDANEDLQDLANAVNDVLEEQFEAVFYNTDTPLIKDEYAGTNGQEMFAGIHEEMQRDGVNKSTIEVLYREYPDFCQVYFSYFEPNTLQKREFNRLFNREGSSGGIEELPFPEVDDT